MGEFCSLLLPLLFVQLGSPLLRLLLLLLQPQGGGVPLLPVGLILPPRCAKGLLLSVALHLPV